MVSSRKQGQQLSGVKIFRKELPEGFVINGVAYIEWPVWGPGNVLERDGTIAHELTHVASMGMLGRSPHSLLEGLAMYEEDSYLRTLGVHLTLGSISHLYASGGFPSSAIWRTRVTDWGLRNPTAVDLCYEDGQAMSAVIMQRHGGAAGIARLAKAFNAHARRAPRRALQRGAGARGVPAGAGSLVRPGGGRGARLRRRERALTVTATSRRPARQSGRCLTPRIGRAVTTLITECSRAAAIDSIHAGPRL